ncbi:protein YgfX [Denitromonas iodatirespirans]|uniref:Uncharacterized protein n=1 Tax=Denitromonas iodatirespirans TaxID=2795389 RepID=A0A944HB82_DENI1|nr:protein YgfX [Denitromonas iodatirespirans]MBT0961387.1 hypothetical protein [Denitromonas iodatirespirans]
MPEAVFRLPLTLALKPSRDLSRLSIGAGGGAALVLLLTPGVAWYVVAGALCLMAVCGGLARRRPATSQTLCLLPDGRWIPPGESEACELAPSSVDMAGVLWLHGRNAHGRRFSLMVLPDSLGHPDGWRWLCIWFRNAPGERPGSQPVGPEGS